HYRVHEVEGMIDHRMTPGDPVEKIFRLRHDLDMPEGSALAELLGARKVKVNSLHGQGVKRLAPGIVAEGRAPDGLIEAIRVTGAKTFAFGVQWHAEWAYDEDPVSRALFGAFAADARGRATRRHPRTDNLV
ncbi:MAG: gamma-glutamyl-gamma-aminobutyrate hydrolase family protein, partial [Alphaproteobacteria bacterium]